MSRHVIIGGLLLVAGILIGMNLPTLYAQQGEGRRGAPPTLTNEQLSQEVATLRQLVPTNSTIMMDVQWHWTNLWWAGRRHNWPLAQYYFNEARGHIQQLVRKNPTIKNQIDGTDVELQGIFDGIDTSSLAMVKESIEHVAVDDATRLAYVEVLQADDKTACAACLQRAFRWDRRRGIRIRRLLTDNAMAYRAHVFARACRTWAVRQRF